MSAPCDFVKLKDMFMDIDIVYDFISKAQTAYELGDISSAYHFISSAYKLFMEENTNYTLSELITLDQCFLAITNEYAEFKETESFEGPNFSF